MISTSQKTRLKANSIRPYPAAPRLLARLSVTATDVPRHTTSARLNAAKLEAIRRGGGAVRGGSRGDVSSRVGAGIEARVCRRRTGLDLSRVMAMRGRTSL